MGRAHGWLIAATLVARTAAADPDWQETRTGLVVEASAGGGILRHGPWGIVFSVFAQSNEVARFEALALGGAVGAGLWLQPRVALTLRATALAFRTARLDPSHVARTVVDSFVGPQLQYWLAPLHGPLTGEPTLWIAGGMGVAILAGTHDYQAYGLGLDARVGYAMGPLQLSVEATEGIFDLRFNAITAVFTVGYQNL